MRYLRRPRAWLLLAAIMLPCVAGAQAISADYSLPLRTSSGGAGLSIEAGQQWFGRLTVGRSLETDQLALGGGYRWRDGQAVSLQFSRARGQERLGLAVRYEWPRYFVRFGYDPRSEGTSESLRFSAGIRF